MISTYLKIVGCVLLTVIICIILTKQSKETSLLLSIIVCSIIGVAAFSFLAPVIDFALKLQTTAKLNSQVGAVLLKSVGLGLLTQITVLVCNDAGNTALAKTLQIASGIILLRLALPLFEELIDIVESILGNI